MSDVTIFIPTYNRPQWLNRTAAFLQHGSVRLPMIVADGSEPEAATANQAACRELGTNIEYFHMPSATDPGGSAKNYLRRFSAALARVKTPYVVCCADDDLLLPETAVKAADFLANNPDYVGCQGVYLNFRYKGDEIRLESRGYDSPTVDADSIGGRLIQFYSRYEAPYYAVFRTAAQRSIFEDAQDITTPMLVETYQAAGVVTYGKLKRLNDLYYLRNLGVRSHARPVEGWNQWMAKDFDDFFAHYRGHRDKVMALISSRGESGADMASVKRIVDMSFILYVGREFHMGYWIDEFLTTAVADAKERNRLRHQLTASLITPQAATASLGGALKASLKRTVKRALGERGRKFALRHVNPATLNFAEMVPLAQNPAIRLPRGLLASFAESDWALLGQRYRAD
jgi:glycosyltransferase domain-containing protein